MMPSWHGKGEHGDSRAAIIRGQSQDDADIGEFGPKILILPSQRAASTRRVACQGEGGTATYTGAIEVGKVD